MKVKTCFICERNLKPDGIYSDWEILLGKYICNNCISNSIDKMIELKEEILSLQGRRITQEVSEDE